MSRFGSPDAWLALGGYNLTGHITNFTAKQEAKTEENTVLGSSFQLNAFTGVRMAEVSWDGFYDNATQAIDEALRGAQIGAARVMVFGVEGQTTGVKFTGWSGALESNYEITAQRDSLTKVKAMVKNGAGGVVEGGVILRPIVAATATGFGQSNANSASKDYIDFSASNVSGAAAYMMITSLTGVGASGVQVEIMHSVDHETWSSYGGFNVVSTTTPNSSWAQRINSTAPIQRYVTERHRDAGGSTFASAVFFVGLAPH